MSLIAQSTNVLAPPFSRDLGGNTYQYETKVVGGRRTKRRRHSQKRSRYSRKSTRSTSRAGGRLKKRSLKK